MWTEEYVLARRMYARSMYVKWTMKTQRTHTDFKCSNDVMFKQARRIKYDMSKSQSTYTTEKSSIPLWPDLCRAPRSAEQGKHIICRAPRSEAHDKELRHSKIQ
jgi:hypothetical protein